MKKLTVLFACLLTACLSAQQQYLWQKCTPDETGTCDVWADGGVNLTASAPTAIDADPQWSLDHTKIVFMSTRNGNPDIYTMNADGTNVVQLTTDAMFEAFGSFSPNGQKIVFSRAQPPVGKLQLFTMNADGTNQTRFTTSTGNDEEPDYLPDGTRILFGSDRSGSYQIYSVKVNGTNLLQLTTGSQNRYPQYAPNGTKIVFASERTGHWEIFIMNSNGSGAVQLTSTAAPGFNADPSWSSDGTFIVFASTRDGNAEVYRMNTDGSSQTRLTTDTTFDAGPFAR